MKLIPQRPDSPFESLQAPSTVSAVSGSGAQPPMSGSSPCAIGALVVVVSGVAVVAGIDVVLATGADVVAGAAVEGAIVIGAALVVGANVAGMVVVSGVAVVVGMDVVLATAGATVVVGTDVVTTAAAVVVSVATTDGHEIWMSVYSFHADTLAAPFVYTVNAVRWSAGWSASPFEYAK